MDKSKKSGERTLLMSVIMSSPGPIVVGIGLIVGRSSTQLADFLRRTAELLAIIVSYFIYKILNKKGDREKEVNKDKLENIANKFVGFAMLISGIVMVVIAIFSANSEKGNVIPGLSIAFLGLITNTWFWLRYSKLGKINGDSILLVQSKLYGAKSFVDACVFIVLLLVLFFPLTSISYFADIGGSFIVSIYLIFNGVSILKNPDNINLE